MNEINDANVVKRQYATANNLNTRISIHQKYSVNQMGFGNWIVSNYQFKEGMKVLELGCGTGDMWNGKDEKIALCSRIILTDFSEGMLETAKKNLVAYEKFEYQVVDIQEIPFESDSFDVVIANMMLYHVPDLEKGLAEVRRIMKPDGTFYCATYGEHGIIEHLSKLLCEYGVGYGLNKNFTLQNGGAILSKTFGTVDKLEYIDSLRVTDLDDIVEYIYSFTNMTALSNVPKEEVKRVLAKHMVDGVLEIPKEYGMFVAKA